MTNASLSLAYRFIWFVAICLLFAFAAIWIIQSSYFRIYGEELSVALTFDLALVLPAIYFLLIRKTAIPKITIIPIFFLSVVMTGYVIPESHHKALHLLEYVLAPMELLVLGFVGYKVHRVTKQFKSVKKASDSDFILILREVLMKNLGSQLVANVLASEIAMFFYAFAGWRRHPLNGSPVGFTYHKEVGYNQLNVVIGLLLVVETFIVHNLLLAWSLTAAWVFTSLSIYGLIFLLGDFNAVHARPIEIDGTRLHVKLGFRWFFSVDLNQIDLVEKRGDVDISAGHANFILFGSPNVLIRFRAPLTATGMYGLARRFSSCSLHIDQAEEFILAIRSHTLKA